MHGRARPEPSEPVDPAGLSRCWGEAGQRLRQDDIRSRHRREAESRRQHADDLRACRTQQDRTLQLFGSDPRTVRHNSSLTSATGWRAVAGIVLRSRRPSAGLNAQRLEGIGRDNGPLDDGAVRPGRTMWTESAEPGQRLERVLPGAQVDEISDRDVGFSQAGRQIAVPQHDEFSGTIEWERTQQCGFDDGEESRVGADPQRKGQNGGRGEARFAGKDAKCLAHVMCPHGPLDEVSRVDV